jgi:hypothetical protein
MLAMAEVRSRSTGSGDVATCDASYCKRQQHMFFDVLKAEPNVNWAPVGTAVLAHVRVLVRKRTEWPTVATFLLGELLF